MTTKKRRSGLFVLLLAGVLLLAACGPTPSPPTPTPTPPVSYHWISPKQGESIKNTINISISLQSGGMVRKLAVFVEQSGRMVPFCTAGESGTTWACHGKVKDIRPRLDAGNIDVFFTAYNAQGKPVLSRSSSVTIKYIEPGGLWISPSQGPLTRIVRFAAHAYRTFPQDPDEPALDHVNFTVYQDGKWQIACTVNLPSNGDVYSCAEDLTTLGVIAGQITISFDVYERGGYYNLSPSGEHIFQYTP